ncbi:putative conjugal transfert protein TraC [Novosphingobium resinovorum]|uniref:Putative conjugal transfert protein TraC n=2 Tax=Novosphingobium resinovorum TaxID=158500 RepID=A0A031JBV4_9SPHN|nr:putative conjugal transfert protein TraC [Novosphingobium resinovorum]
MMRKVRDYDAELKALGDKAKALKTKKVQQLGELVASTGADVLDADVLAGALLHIVAEAQVEGNREAWRSDGAAFFQRRRRKAGDGSANNGQSAGETPTGGSQS